MYRVILILLLLFYWAPVVSGMDFHIPEIELESQAALLMEPLSGEVVLQVNMHEQLPPASLTKVMTMLLIMEALEQEEISLQDPVLVSDHAAEMGGSEIWLEPGEGFSLEELLKAVAISSANDASVALAEHLYGSEALFVQAMNRRVEELQLTDTFFANASGLPLAGQESHITAYDIAVLSRELLKYPQILQWTSIWLDYLRDGETELNNTNRLVVDFQGADGLKTGWTEEAGHCVVATASRNGIRLLVVILNHPDSAGRFQEAVELLSLGFGLFRPLEVVKEGEYIREIQVRMGTRSQVALLAKEDLILPVPRGREEELFEEIRLSPGVMAPVAAGERLGQLSIFQKETLLGSVDLLAEEGVEKAGFLLLVKQLLAGILTF